MLSPPTIFPCFSVRTIAATQQNNALQPPRWSAVAHRAHSWLEMLSIAVQMDVGIGDVTVSEPVWLDYPSLLDLPRPRMRAYAIETVVAETHADQLTASTAATFARRKTPVPEQLHIRLSDKFALDPLKRSRNDQTARPRDAEVALAQVRSLPKPALARLPPTRQTARKRRLNFLYLARRRRALGRSSKNCRLVSEAIHVPSS